MITDKNNNIIEIGDIVKITGSPVKSDNATYVVAQDGTSEMHSGCDLTLYKVAKHKNGYALSRSKYNICFYPLACYSNRYKYSKTDLEVAEIEILIKNDISKISIVKKDDSNEYDIDNVENSYFRCSISIKDGKEIEDTNYSVTQVEKLSAFLSNISLKDDEEIKIFKQSHSYEYYRKSIEYTVITVKDVMKEEIIVETENEPIKLDLLESENNYTYEVSEDVDTRTEEKIYLVKVVEKLDREEYLKVNKYIKSIGGYYSRFKGAFLFKNNPEILLNGNKSEIDTEETLKEENKETYSFEIKEDIHSKSWLVNIDKELGKTEFAEVKRKLATIQGFYSSFKKAFIFKYDPTEKLKIT